MKVGEAVEVAVGPCAEGGNDERLLSDLGAEIESFESSLDPAVGLRSLLPSDVEPERHERFDGDVWTAGVETPTDRLGHVGPFGGEGSGRYWLV